MNRIVRGNAAERMAWAYGHADNRTIREVYRNPSPAKVAAYEEIIHYASSQGYYDFRIMTHNSFAYTLGYRKGRELVVETKENRYIVPLTTTTLLHYVNGDF